METTASSPRPTHKRRLLLIMSIVAISFIAVAALVVPHIIHAATAPTRATNACAQPPAGKDPTAFTSQQLRAYGLPLLHPHQDKTLWLDVVRHATHRVCTTTDSPALSHWQNTFFCNSCWAGYEVNDSTRNFAWVNGTWQVPIATSTDVGSSFSVWVGLGGDGNRNLVQTGVVGVATQQWVTIPRHEFPPPCPNCPPVVGTPVPLPPAHILEDITTYQAWFENIADPTNPAPIPAFPVNAGDTMYAEVDAPNFMFISDSTTGTYKSLTSGPAAVTTQAECIVEAPRQNFGNTNLLDFGVEDFTTCHGYDQASNTLDFLRNLGAMPRTIVDSSGQPLTSLSVCDTCSPGFDFRVRWLQGT